MNIVVFQTDNRDYPMIKLISSANEKQAKFLKYNYQFEIMNKKYYEQMSPCTAKIFVVHNLIHTQKIDILVFLDTDAWIQNPYKLSVLIEKLKASDKHGCFSRDPYLSKNTFINSGSFILKIDDYCKKMYKTLIKNMYESPEHINKYPYDQHYISNFIYENKQEFFIFNPEVLNTPNGIILRHNWHKTEQMVTDIRAILQDSEELLDTMPYPNPG